MENHRAKSPKELVGLPASFHVLLQQRAGHCQGLLPPQRQELPGWGKVWPHILGQKPQVPLAVPRVQRGALCAGTCGNTAGIDLLDGLRAKEGENQTPEVPQKFGAVVCNKWKNKTLSCHSKISYVQHFIAQRFSLSHSCPPSSLFIFIWNFWVGEKVH